LENSPSFEKIKPAFIVDFDNEGSEALVQKFFQENPDRNGENTQFYIIHFVVSDGNGGPYVP
jgi:hypothetical protein